MRKGRLEKSQCLATDKHAVVREGALQLSTSLGALLGGEFGVADAGVPIGDEGAVGRAGDGVF